MDRFVEFIKLTKIFGAVDDDADRESSVSSSPFTQLSCAISNQLIENDNIVTKLSKLVSRKEFSNDPTEEISQLSKTFESNVNIIQTKLNKLNQYEANNYDLTSHSRQHLKIIIQQFKVQLSNQIQQFKDMLKKHSIHMKQRQDRVSRYGGTTSDTLRPTLTTQSEYAMFSKPLLIPPPPPPPLSTYNSQAPSSSSSSTHLSPPPASLYPTYDSNPQLRRRTNQASTAASTSHDIYASQQNYSAPSSSGYPQQKQQQQQVTAGKRTYYQEQSMKSAEKIEAKISQMGELFSQMSTLIMEQNETILRIEDDVESGLTNTIDAQKSMQQLYEITKGNRGMIIKIFLLLILFIVVFLIIF